MGSVSAWHVALLILGAFLALKDEVLQACAALVDAALHVEGLRLLITRYWRHYHATLAPSHGPDVIEVGGVVLMCVALVLLFYRSRAGSASRP